MSKVYVGRARGTVGAGEVLVKQGDEVKPLTHRVHHSPDGFSWGYHGSGPAELARCLLWDHLGEQPEPAMYQALKDEVIAKFLQGSFWTLTENEVRSWVEDWEGRP